MFNLQKMYEYLRFLDEFRKIKRVLYVTGEDRSENDMEHSYQLTMLAWYLIDTYSLKMDADLVMKYCLVHDLVEAYAGDTYIYSQDPKHHESKAQREEEALETIKQHFQEFPNLSLYIEQYEQKNDQEALFVYALDKIIPVLNIYMDNGRTWKDTEFTKITVTLEKIRENKDDKIRQSPELHILWTQFVEILEKNKHNLFLPE